MNARIPFSPQFTFWGICIIATAWLMASVLFEMHLGLPAGGLQWAKRLIGWLVEFWMLRTLMNGLRRGPVATMK